MSTMTRAQAARGRVVCVVCVVLHPCAWLRAAQDGERAAAQTRCTLVCLNRTDVLQWCMQGGRGAAVARWLVGPQSRNPATLPRCYRWGKRQAPHTDVPVTLP